MKNFKNKTAVITGAASGIGRGLAEHCAREGMKVVLADVEEIPLKETEQSLRDRGAQVLAVVTDVSRLRDVEALAEKTLDTFGGVNLLFNNAGVGGLITPLWELTEADWKWLMGVNLWGVIHGIRVFVPMMLRSDTECHIINTASMAALMLTPAGAYSMTKHGVVGLTEALYIQLRERKLGIGLSLLIPGVVRSRILEAYRNRPPELQNRVDETSIEAIEPPLMQPDYAMSPERCAEIVFGAIREERFYILTDSKYKEDIRERMENILEDRNPVPGKHFP
ncbi:SDR family NAD(P)-dependent oxidoreductase [Chloroflexota bacterium]